MLPEISEFTLYGLLQCGSIPEYIYKIKDKPGNWCIHDYKNNVVISIEKHRILNIIELVFIELLHCISLQTYSGKVY